MKIFVQSPRGLGRLALIPALAFTGMLVAPPLRAQQPATTPPPLPAPSVPTTLPPPPPEITILPPGGWKVTNPEAALAAAGATPHAVPGQAGLVFTAAPTDSRHGVSISLYRIVYRATNAPLAETGAGIDAEKEKMSESIFMQGYSITGAPQVFTTTTIQGKQLVTLRIYGKNAAGETRVFNDIAAVGPPTVANSFRLYASYPITDPATPPELDAIVKTLNIPDIATPADTTTASATPQTPGAAISGGGENAPVSARTSQLVQDYHGSLVLVEGSKGVGSGFLCSLGGHSYIITNAHVLSDNIGIKVTSLDAKVLTSGSSAVAVGHDIVKMEIPAGPKTFEVMDNLDSTAKIGDTVMVPGNVEGGSVVKPMEGKIVGIGPNLIEVDAPFVHGNSGSPIIHLATGKVIGVATYMSIRKVKDDNSGKVTIDTRRFGFRIDSVKEWQPINWQVFFAESEQVAQIEELSEDFIHLFDDFHADRRLSPNSYKSQALSRVVKNFMEDVDRMKTSGSKADRDNLLRRFFADLRSTTRNDISAFNARPAYDYFRKNVEEEGRFRDEIYDIFTKQMQDHSP